MANFLRSRLKYYYHKVYQKVQYDTLKTLVSLGRIHSENNKTKKNIKDLEEVEFQVFSQRGEDGIIQYIVSQIEIPNRIFVEFGVENYTEANTRLLLVDHNWAGLVIDGSKENIRFIKNDFIYWKYDITACLSFINKNNINELISGYTSCSDAGLLSIDLDGNDYWIWEAITAIQPRIIVCEYNSAFGPSLKVSVPYDPNFVRTKAHYSNLYFGASLAALCYLAEKKGYDFIGTAGAGVNAFFVRKDVSGPFMKYKAEEGFRKSANRDSKDKTGRLTFLGHEERIHVIKKMSLIDVTTGTSHLIKDLYAI